MADALLHGVANSFYRFMSVCVCLCVHVCVCVCACACVHERVHTVRFVGQASENSSNSLLHVPKQKVDESLLSSAVEQLEFANNALVAVLHVEVLLQSIFKYVSLSVRSTPCCYMWIKN